MINIDINDPSVDTKELFDQFTEFYSKGNMEPDVLAMIAVLERIYMWVVYDKYLWSDFGFDSMHPITSSSRLLKAKTFLHYTDSDLDLVYKQSILLYETWKHLGYLE
jgi:hypothetical protein